MKKRLLCKLGFHIWYDAMNIQNNEGHFDVQKCMKCQDFKVYTIYSLRGYPKLYLLKYTEIPKNILKNINILEEKEK